MPGSGGTTGAGGATRLDAALDQAPDLARDLNPDLALVTMDAAPDRGPDLAPDLALDLAPDTVDAPILPPGLVLYYPCEAAKSDGTTLPDMSGNGNDGLLKTWRAGGTGFGFGTGAVGNALVLTAAGSGYVDLPLSVFAGAGDITIATWVKVTTRQDYQKVFDIGINAGLGFPNSTGMIYMYLAPYRPDTGLMTFGIATNGYNDEQAVASTTVGPSDGWKHLAIVLGNSGAVLYVDGTSVASSTNITLRPRDLGNINYAWIGRSQFTSDAPFDGAFDEFRIYHRALSSSEIRTLFQYTQP